MIEKDEFNKITNLARIFLTEEEKDVIFNDFFKIINYVDKIKEVKTDKVSLKEINTSSSLRNDNAIKSENGIDLVKSFNNKEGFLKVNRVIKKKNE